MHRSEKAGSGVGGNAFLPCFEDDGTNATFPNSLFGDKVMHTSLSIIKGKGNKLAVLSPDLEAGPGVEGEVRAEAFDDIVSRNRGCPPRQSWR